MGVRSWECSVPGCERITEAQALDEIPFGIYLCDPANGGDHYTQWAHSSDKKAWLDEMGVAWRKATSPPCPACSSGFVAHDDDYLCDDCRNSVDSLTR